MEEHIEFMLNRFPTHRSKIIDQYLHNDEFKTLCQDLYSSARLLEVRQKLLLSHSMSELEYRKLFLDLENEVARFLDTARRPQPVAANSFRTNKPVAAS